MSEVTAIKVGNRRGRRLNVFLDGKFAFSLEAEVAAKQGLKVGQELSGGQIEVLARSDGFHRCLNAAARYLSYRPRSEFEVRQRLQQRGFGNESIEAVIAKLKEQGLVDELAFAEFWKGNRESFSPRSQRLTRLELKQKGVSDDLIDQVVDEIDDTENAYRAALSKARSLLWTDYRSFRQRLGEYLRRRGFDYGVINHTVGRLWQELGKQD